MNAQLRAVAALQTCASCVAAGAALELISTKICIHTANELGVVISVIIYICILTTLCAGSCAAASYESCEALECPHLYERKQAVVAAEAAIIQQRKILKQLQW